jgi:hypothetical protein
LDKTTDIANSTQPFTTATMSRWADSTDDDDDYLHEGDHEDYVEHAVGADQVSVCFPEDDSKHD